MKLKIAAAAAALACCAGIAHAEDYNATGKTFGTGQLDKLHGQISDTNAKNTPFYTADPPQKSAYSATSLFDVGSSRITSCKTASASGDKIADQECNAVNFLAKNPENRVHFTVSTSDPAVIAARGQANNAGTMLDSISGGSACTDKTTTTPAQYSTSACTQYIPIEDKTCTMGETVNVNADSNFQCDSTYKAVETLSCDKVLTTACQYEGTNMTGLASSRVLPFLQPTMTINTSKTGLYDYAFSVPHKTCGTEGHAELDFNLDSVGDGSYMTMNLSNLDDSAVVSVNGQPIFAGYPNSGPYYTSSTLGTNNTSFQMNYSWKEQIGGQCLRYITDDNGNNPVCTSYVPISTQSFTATTKLLDYCPSGYSKVSQDPGVQDCGDSGACYYPPDSSSWNNMQGFFCNAEGKFLMNRHEGPGTWSGTVNAQANLKVGSNSIVVYWGTAANSGACGNIDVAGQIYNVSPKCTDTWMDNCTSLEARSQ